MGVFGARDGGGHITRCTSKAGFQLCMQRMQTWADPAFLRSLSFPILGRVSQIDRGCTCWKSVLLALPGLSPAPHLPRAFCGAAVGTASGERGLEGLREPRSRCVTAHAGPLGAECFPGSLVTQPDSLLPVCRGTEGGQLQLLLPPSRAGDPQPAGVSPDQPPPRRPRFQFSGSRPN